MLSVNCSEDVLRLSKSPSIRTSGIFVGIVSLGLGAAYYGSENILFKSLYVFGSFIIGASFLDEWECFRFLKPRNVSLHLSSVMAVRVESRETDRGGGRTRKLVTLLLTSGMSLPLLDGNTFLSKSQCDMLADKIRRFLKLNHVENVEFMDLDDSNYYSDRDSSSSGTEAEPLANAGHPRDTITTMNENR